MYGHNGLEVSGGANFDRAPNLGRETRRRWPKAVSARICSTTVCRAGASGCSRSSMAVSPALITLALADRLVEKIALA